MANDPSIRYVSKDDAIAIVRAAKAAYTNQDAIGKVKVGETIFTADEAVDQIELIEGANVQLSISGDAITIAATDTTYDPAVAPATGVEGSDGLMSKEDKGKLDAIEAGAEVNQNAFSTIVAGATSIVADSKTDTLSITAGSNVTITGDATNDGITIESANTEYTLGQDAADGHVITLTPSTGQAQSITIPDNDTTYNPATPSTAGVGGTDGLLTASDKEKLDGVEAGAEVNTLETVKVNGTSLTPDGNKAVDITVTTGDSGIGTIKVNGTQVTAYGLGSAAGAAVETTGVDSDTNTLPTTAQVKSYVDTTISTTYKAAGSLAPAGVVAGLLVAGNEGKVYNLSADLTLDATTAALFVDGAAGDVIVAGTNIVVIKSGNDYLFDKLAGFIDLSGYVQTDDLGHLTATEIAEILAEI